MLVMDPKFFDMVDLDASKLAPIAGEFYQNAKKAR